MSSPIIASRPVTPTGPASPSILALEDTPVSTFRLDAKKLFLTYPQCDSDPQGVMEMVKYSFPNLEWAVVAREQHKDGTPHLHLAIALTKPYRARNHSLLDSLTATHGNYQAMKKPTECLRYIIKDGDYIEHNINVNDFLKAAGAKRTTVMAKIAHQIAAGTTIMEIDEQFPQVMIMHRRKIEDYMEWKARAAPPQLPPWTPVPIDLAMPFQDAQIATWLNANVLQKKRDPAATHLYIHGSTALGKTTLVSRLAKWLRIYYIPPDEDNYDAYQDGAYDIAFLDEFKGQKTIQWLNAWLQGHPFPLKRRFASTLKKDNLPTIIVSNYTLKEVYKKVDDQRLATLERRLTCIHVSTFISLFQE